MDKVIVGIIVGLSAFIMIRRFMKKLKPGDSGGCGGCCGCDNQTKGACGFPEKMILPDSRKPQD